MNAEEDTPFWPPPLDDAACAAGWRDAWHALGATAPRGLRERLVAAWSEPHRHYHAARHLAECLALLERWRPATARPAELTLALWFHDAVYDPRAADNEARSAAWAADSLRAAGAAHDAAERIAGLVMATRHDAPCADGADTALLQDIDLAVLGSPTARYAAYCRDVRLEYAHVPEPAWRSGRAAVLRSFLDRPRLYRSAPAAAVFEEQARVNLSAEVERLAC